MYFGVFHKVDLKSDGLANWVVPEGTIFSKSLNRYFILNTWSITHPELPTKDKDCSITTDDGCKADYCKLSPKSYTSFIYCIASYINNLRASIWPNSEARSHIDTKAKLPHIDASRIRLFCSIWSYFKIRLLPLLLHYREIESYKYRLGEILTMILVKCDRS